MTITGENFDTEMGNKPDLVGEMRLKNIHKGEDGNEEFDEDGKPRRTGTVWTASAHIITAIIGSGVLSLAWCVAQLGWIAGPLALFTFSFITFYTSTLLADCYRSPDPVNGKRNYTYMEAVKANLGGAKYMICGVTQYINLVGISIGLTVTASISMVAIQKSICYHKEGHEASCAVSNNPPMISFGIFEIVLSQIPNIHKLSWLSTVAAIMSFSYTLIGVALSLQRIISGNTGNTSLGGIEVGPDVSEVQKVWRSFSALGDIAFAYSFSLILIEVQDTLRSPPAENREMKKATMIGVTTTTLFYVMCGCVGYAAFGSNAPGNLLTGFGFYKPFWLIDFANVCIVVHIVGAYQVFSQTVFAAFEAWVIKKWQTSKFITREYVMNIAGKRFKINCFRLVWRSIFVMFTTVLAMAMPFFNDVLALLGAMGYWPLTVYFPIEMYIAQKKMKRFTFRWVALELLNFGCLVVAVAAACGSIQGLTKALQVYKPFTSKQ
ncbi:hypothetical protein GIB67_027905 [Kingdonia uniflora]|uniref:Amino acid transporter transmembrane domain-containing protein n=1 Tax=Kingdonia uniflora TaxID=39325 RepID=A0A7J7LGG0_9MAGN|nr:hypothetical protein GIB67_027905 [Kingdonia uniflora]